MRGKKSDKFCTIYTRMKKEEKKALEELSEQEGLTLTNFIRVTLSNAVAYKASNSPCRKQALAIIDDLITCGVPADDFSGSPLYKELVKIRMEVHHKNIRANRGEETEE